MTNIQYLEVMKNSTEGRVQSRLHYILLLAWNLESFQHNMVKNKSQEKKDLICAFLFFGSAV